MNLNNFAQIIVLISLHLPSILSSEGSHAFAQTASPSSERSSDPLERIRVSEDGTHFVKASSRDRFVVWGVNYDHDQDGRLLDEYWIDEWKTVVEDFHEMKELGANCVRIHLQLGMFMEAADRPNEKALRQLKKLVELAESTRLYLDITGLACYHKKNIPTWYDALDESKRWDVQANFWEVIAKTCGSSPAIFCYDLMNEPILPGKKAETEWLTGELGGKFFVQRLSLDAKGRDRKEIASAWVNRMTASIRKHDKDHMVTVGVIPWVFVFGGKGEPLFYSLEVSEPLDFVAVHFYPEKDKIDDAIAALKRYEIGKPLVIEEMFPLKTDIDSMDQFIRRSAIHTDGWISFYWGTPAETLKSKKDATLVDSMIASWLDRFHSLSTVAKNGQLQQTPKTDFQIVSDVAYVSEAATPYQQERCKLDWYLPKDTTDFPTIVWFHGGALQNGDKAGKNEVALAKRFASQGIGVVCVNYRLSPQAKYPAYIEDAAAAVAFVYKNVAAYGGAQKHVFVSGHSAGGYLTAMVAVDPQYLKKHDLEWNSIAGYMPVSGQMITHSTVRGERDIPKTQPIIDAAAPAFHATSNTAPFLCIAGSNDLPARAEENRYFVAAMKAAGHESISYAEFDGRDHGTIANRLSESDDAVALAIIDFIRERCGN